MSNQIKYLLLMAAGTGQRMQSKLPKQFLDLNGIPIFIRSLQKFKSAIPDIQVFIVSHPDHKELVEKLLAQHEISNVVILNGAATRFGSVKNGIDALPEEKDAFLAIHDAVRPLLSVSLIRSAFNGLEAQKALIPVIKVKDSIRQIDQNSSKTIPRASLRAVQTPQCFQLNIIRQAYQKASKLESQDHFTDSASVVEAMGVNIGLLEGEENNIKLTHPLDLHIAEKILENDK